MDTTFLTVIVAVWLFPERVVGTVFLFVYLFVWLPWGMIPSTVHIGLLGLYMLVPIPKWDGFRSLWIWNWLRRVAYPVKYFDRVDYHHHHNRQVMYAIAPHGIFSENVLISMILNERFMHVTPVAASILTWIPIVKDVCAVAGITPANREDILHTLSVKKQSVTIVPEGLRGILCEGEPSTIPKRQGFVECAVEAGDVLLVPIYVDGTQELYTRWPASHVKREDHWFRRFQHWMLSSRLRYCFVLSWGKWGGCMPLTGKEIRVFYGDPIVCGPKKSPHQDGHLYRDTVNFIHAKYTAEMEHLKCKAQKTRH